MFCGECGAANLDGAQFCEECGAGLIASTSAGPAQRGLARVRRFATRKSIAALAAMALATGGYFWWSGRQANGEEAKLDWPIPLQIGDKCQYLTEAGKLLPQKFDEAYAFFANNPITPVKIDNRYGFVDRTGNIIVKPIYDDAWFFDNYGRGFVSFDKHWGIIDKNGKLIVKPQFDNIVRDNTNTRILPRILPIRKNNRVGYIDEYGSISIPPQFDSALPFYDGDRAAIAVAGSWGFIDRSGKIVISPKYTSIGPQRGRGDFLKSDPTKGIFGKLGLAPVSINKEWGYIDKTGTQVIAPQFEAAGSFSESGIAPAMRHGDKLWGYIDRTGKFIIEPQFDFADSFGKNGVAWVSVGKLLKLIDVHGNELFSSPGLNDIGYDGFEPNGLAQIEFAERDESSPGFTQVWNTRWGLIDASGKIVLNPQYQDEMLYIASSNEYLARNQDKLDILDSNGKLKSQISVSNLRTNGPSIVCHPM